MANTDLLQIQDMINAHKENLANNLTNKEVSASKDETLTALIGKVSQITGGGGSSLDWSKMTDMDGVFNGKSELFKFLAPSINCDMSQVTKWDRTFWSAITINNKNNEIFQNVNFLFTTLSQYQFNTCSGLTNINVSDDYSTTNMNHTFYGCKNFPLSKAIEIINKNKNVNSCDYSYCCSECGQTAVEPGTDIIDEMNVHASSMEYMFSSCTNLLKFGNITNNSAGCKLSYLFSSCKNLDKVGLITVRTLSTASNIFRNSDNLRIFGGIKILNTDSNLIVISNTGSKLLETADFNKLEECLNIPISYFSYGALNIGNLFGTESSRKPLKRLTFSTTDIPYLNKNYAKSFNIAYCSFDRGGMVEMFNSLPDANDVTGAKIITITGNPCVDNGTLTDDDIAIATVKGYTIKTA